MLDIRMFSRSTYRYYDFVLVQEILSFSRFSWNHFNFSWKLRVFMTLAWVEAMPSGMK